MGRSIQQLFDLSGKTALVTEGAQGQGLQMAHAMGEAGARVVISARQADDLEQAVAQLQAAGIDARWIAADCAKESEIVRLTSETLQRVGEVDILVNNAGPAWGAPAEDHPLEAWNLVMNLNIRGYLLLSQAIAKKSMMARRAGRIINLASIAGLGGNPAGIDTLAYNTAKGTLIAFTQALAAEWGKYNITVNAIGSGFPPSRLGDDAGLKGLSVLFASDAGEHITGQYVTSQRMAMDGGVSIVNVRQGGES